MSGYDTRTVCPIGKDLTFEGIATISPAPPSSCPVFGIGKDLTFEGIATIHSLCHQFLDGLQIGKDLTFEGIATTLTRLYPVNFILNRKRPDIRRDCDLHALHKYRLRVNIGKDLTFEGIATLDTVEL